jgi:hypothetical protein
MPLNKLENFIKNTEGRILYVSPSDLDATDAIENQGNSLTKPFKTIQRALIEAARFSYLRGTDNDEIEKTTVLLYPGEHVVDNRPGFAIRDDSGTATAVAPSGSTSTALTEFALDSDTNFDLTQEGNQLYKFNSINGGTIVPRGTSLVGLDLRKTKIRPLYVPNPTDTEVPTAAIFRITGTCYFWQFSLFDGNESGLVYTDKSDFGASNRSKPTFSHHKLTCFEYADGVNIPSGYTISDLDMYYAKLSNAYGKNSANRDIDQKYPANAGGFTKQRAESEIVGAFASDPISVSSIISGDGSTPSSVITVTTAIAHGLNAGTPIKIKGVGVSDYNISGKVQNVINATEFTYTIPFVRANLPATASAASATITVETDTVSGASPYIFNISLRSVFGMNGMHTDGSKATGFRSMVVAQFTGISLQKDDRAFVKYNTSSRLYDSLNLIKKTGSALATESSSTDASTVYHLDSSAIYRNGWETCHIKITNDAVLQIVSVFAIGYNKHFELKSGGDASITNSNSNFGQLALVSEGFKKEAFVKDDRAYLTSLITPKALKSTEENVDWVSLDVGLTTSVGITSHLYLFGYTEESDKPPVIISGYRVGARKGEKLSLSDSATGTTSTANILMANNIGDIIFGNNSSFKEYSASVPVNNVLTLGTHNIITGEKIKLISDVGDLPENITSHKTYFAIKESGTELKIASSLTNAENDTAVTIIGGSQLRVLSRVSEKESGDPGSPIQFDSANGNWFVHTDSDSGIYNYFNDNGVAGIGARSPVTFFNRREDSRSIDEKLFKFRVCIPKEFTNAKDPEEGFVIQESSSTGYRNNTDFNLNALTASDYDFNRSPRFISTCSVSSSTVTVISEQPHNLDVGDQIVVKNVQSTDNVVGAAGSGYNGTFDITAVNGDKTFTYSTTDTDGNVHAPVNFSNDTSSRTTSLPRFERNDLKSNYYIYRNEVITPYIEDVQDGIYHLYVLNASNSIPTEFTNLNYSQKVQDLYPQLDKDNVDDDPESSKTFALRSPIGQTATSDLKKSLTRETTDMFLNDFKIGQEITGVSTSFPSNTEGTATLTFARPHNFSGIVTATISNGGSGLTNGTYHNIKLLNNGGTTWDGATAQIVVSGNEVTQLDITAGGSGYADGETLDIDATFTGGSGAEVTIANSGISTIIGNTIQITGIGTTASNHYRVTNVPARNQVAVAITNSDPKIVQSQYLINIGAEIQVQSSTFDSVTGLSTFFCDEPHGLAVGNRFKLLNTTNANLGDYLISAVGFGTTSFAAKTNASITAKYVLKHGLGSNDLTSDSTGENLGARSLFFYDNEVAVLQSDITTGTSVAVSVPNAGISTTQRFELGSYIQINSEVMRVVTKTLTGSGNNQLTVIRGALGTIRANHPAGTLIKKIKPRGIEFRRPSIARASGHTFEYLGYGPGNYSTGLPQVQVRTLTEEEDFLSQSQERSCGIVVYTGMNNRGDFFIGNKRVSSATGQEKVFDIPVPTVTGKDPSRLSVVFDEVIVKERILVEGGNSATILSQFDGPVTFNSDVRVNGELKMNSLTKLMDTTDSESVITGAFVVAGGVGIGKRLNVGGGFHLNNDLRVTGIATFTQGIQVPTGIGATFGNIQIGVTDDNTIDTSSGNLTLDSTTNVVDITAATNITGDTDIDGALTVTGDITAFSSSDERLKNDIKPIEDPLAKVTSLSGNTYTWNEKSNKEGEDVGVIAQEVEKVLPEAVTVRGDGYLAVDYHKIIPLLVEAVKELTEKVSTLEEDK